LKGRNIVHVDLVYTAYKESKSFNQKNMNQNRVIALNEYLPQLKNDSPSWSVIEQTGAQSSDEAKKYFHGFVIHYGSTIDYQNQKDFIGEIQTHFSAVEIDNRIGGRAAYYSVSSIEMEKYSATYPDGNEVEGL
jgi:hypothetical protein